MEYGDRRRLRAYRDARGRVARRCCYKRGAGGGQVDNGAGEQMKEKKRIKCTAGEALDWCLAGEKNEVKVDWSVGGVFFLLLSVGLFSLSTTF